MSQHDDTLPSPADQLVAAALDQYGVQCTQLVDHALQQRQQVEQAASWFADSIQAGRLVHMFGSGHSRMLVEEMWPRYASFPGFHPIVELSLTYHNQVVGANGQRQAMFLESQSGLAERIMRNFQLNPADSALVVSSSGCNTVPVEMAQCFRQQGIRVVALVGLAHCQASTAATPNGDKLTDHADLVLDTGIPAGDALVSLPGEESPVGTGSTIGGAIIINAIKVATAARLAAGKALPAVLTAACLVGSERSSELFEAAYDEHARRLAKLFAELGQDIEK
jgi:uncharacterized phosphosugar-binding protein